MSEFETIAQDQLGMTRAKGKETSIWDIEMSPKNYYHVVMHTMKRGAEGRLERVWLHSFNCHLIFVCVLVFEYAGCR